MSKKLTLSIDETTIEKAKRYAKKKKKSLSKLVQEYLQYVAERENENWELELTPTVRKLLGSVKIKEESIEDTRFKYLEEKYLGG
ncbi:MAG: hypothetical protein J7K04_14675 [Spirochaetales bacterium]|nr:hypothetical protein [Spirochaetales bacterium]RKX84115.1 MAG: hypothetical protein DRP57_06530 [Spirochaetota bacterium]